MEKIFEKEVELYLIDFGVSEQEIAKIKYNKYKEGMLHIAKKLVKAIEECDITFIKDHLSNSPAGDCMGIENTIIDFNSIAKQEYCTDIEQALNTLKIYKKQAGIKP